MIGRVEVRLATNRLRQGVVRRVREEAVRLATSAIGEADRANEGVSSTYDEENLTPDPVARRTSRSV